MSSYYPEGSMRGSGIDSYEISRDLDCYNCGNVMENVTVTVDDWGNIDFETECVSCGETIYYERVKGEY
jgi:hypothetical protein